MERLNEALLVGYDRANSNDIPVLVIGVQIPGKGVDVKNVIMGPEATEMYHRFVERKRTHVIQHIFFR